MLEDMRSSLTYDTQRNYNESEVDYLISVVEKEPSIKKIRYVKHYFCDRFIALLLILSIQMWFFPIDIEKSGIDVNSISFEFWSILIFIVFVVSLFSNPSLRHKNERKNQLSVSELYNFLSLSSPKGKNIFDTLSTVLILIISAHSGFLVLAAFAIIAYGRIKLKKATATTNCIKYFDYILETSPPTIVEKKKIKEFQPRYTEEIVF